MSGNKGGVAIRLDLFDTSICFVTAVGPVSRNKTSSACDSVLPSCL